VMAEPRRFMFPFKVLSWDSLETLNGIPMRAAKGELAIGYIPVYENFQTYSEAGFADTPCGTFVEQITTKTENEPC